MSNEIQPLCCEKFGEHFWLLFFLTVPIPEINLGENSTTTGHLKRVMTGWVRASSGAVEGETNVVSQQIAGFDKNTFAIEVTGLNSGKLFPSNFVIIWPQRTPYPSVCIVPCTRPIQNVFSVLSTDWCQPQKVPAMTRPIIISRGSGLILVCPCIRVCPSWVDKTSVLPLFQ